MAKDELKFEDFLNDVSPEYADTVSFLHNFLIESGYGIKMQLAKSGHVVSYTDPKSKRVAVNFVSRKKGPVIRIYGDYANKYIDFLENLPEAMMKSISKSSNCKQLINPEQCNKKCAKGYDLTIKGTNYKKCRYNCFMFDINAENVPYIKTFLENEIRERTA